MAEVIYPTLILLRRLIHSVSYQQETCSAWGIRVVLRDLKHTLELLLAISRDLEEMQAKEEARRLWQRWIKDVLYDADDVMDELSYEFMRRNVKGRDNRKPKVLISFIPSYNPLVFRYKIATKILVIKRSLKKNHHTSSWVGLSRKLYSYGAQGITDQWSRHTTSFMNESEILGREDDRYKLIKLLTTVVTPSDEKISVISIVGMAELGKTTLAQLVYNDQSVKKQFHLRMWVYVSHKFDLHSILRQILESSTQLKVRTTDMSNSDLLMEMVKQELNGKRYLLVLDDLWNVHQNEWESLRSVLLDGDQGSRILITTRMDQVASMVRVSFPSYLLTRLSDDACWSIIEKKASGALNTQEMINIGKEIAKKCCGLPVVAKSVGNLLQSKCTESEWIAIRDGKNSPVLKLSYDNLSPHLKQCFSFCSIFPKNWEISKKTLIQLWMAEGFLEPDRYDPRSIEEMGNEFFDSLVACCFVHYMDKDEFGDIKTCKINDSVHDLAKDVLEDNELASLMVSELKDVSSHRRLQLNLDEGISATLFSAQLMTGKKLRTIFVPEASNLDPAIFNGSKHLRALHVGHSPDRGLTKLTHLSFKLKFLRYLHLSSLDLSEAVNDHPINKLYHLQTLVLTNMSGVQNLLTDIHSLRNLRHLEVSSTDMEVLPDSITSLPELQSLDLNNCRLKAFPDSITRLRSLTCLHMSSNPFEELPSFVLTLRHLQTLDINSCTNLKALPESVSGLDNLKIFNFNNCPLLEALPQDFGALTQLRSLDLRGTEIKVLPDSCANLVGLELVHLYKCELPEGAKNWTNVKRILRWEEKRSTSQHATTSRMESPTSQFAL